MRVFRRRPDQSFLAYTVSPWLASPLFSVLNYDPESVYALPCKCFTWADPRESFSPCHKMVTPEAHASPLRTEGTSDIPT